MTKKTLELEKGDVIRVEYGDYDNFVTVIVDSVEDTPNSSYARILGRYKSNNKPIEMYGLKNEANEVIEQGKETP